MTKNFAICILLFTMVISGLALISCSSESGVNDQETNGSNGNTNGETSQFLMDDGSSTIIAEVNGNKVRYQPFRSYIRYMMDVDPDTLPTEIVEAMLETWLSREAVYGLGVEEGLDRDSLFIFMQFDASRQIITQMVLERITLTLPGVTEADIREAYNKWKDEVKYEKDVVLYQFLSEANAQLAVEMIEQGVPAEEIAGLIGLDTLMEVRRLYSQMELIEEIVAPLNEGELSEPFRLGEGYYLAKVIDERYIESPIAPFDQLRPYIMLYLTEIKKFNYVNQFIDTLIGERVITYPESLKVR
ncbi:MAG: peptidyl-prolyl cis-trans isomerase [bacterium]